MIETKLKRFPVASKSQKSSRNVPNVATGPNKDEMNFSHTNCKVVKKENGSGYQSREGYGSMQCTSHGTKCNSDQKDSSVNPPFKTSMVCVSLLNLP